MVDFVYFLTNLQQTIEIFHDLSPRNITAATLPPPPPPTPQGRYDVYVNMWRFPKTCWLKNKKLRNAV